MYEENRENSTYHPDNQTSEQRAQQETNASYQQNNASAGSASTNASNQNGASGNYSQNSASGSTANAGGYNQNSAYGYYQNGASGYGAGNAQTGAGGGQYGGYQHTYGSAYGSNPTSGSRQPKQKKGKKCNVVFAVVLAAALGLCVGGGVVSAVHWANRSEVKETQEQASGGATLKTAENGQQDEANAGDKASAGSSAEQNAQAGASGGQNGAGLQQGSSKVVTTDVTQVAADMMPSMVSVFNNFTEQAQYFGQTYSQEATSTGSGIIIGKTDTELLIASNNHVVADADSLKVQFVDNTTAEAQIKGTDPGNDLAVIAVDLTQISGDTLNQIKVATLGNSDNLVLGEPVIAIGNALGYGQSVTTGVVSALNREITTENGASGTFIQTDAAINPGNSGGALVDINGEVIGINSNKIGGSTVEGMGYAIPISKAEPIIENLMNQETKTKLGSEEQGYLGISGVSVTNQVSSAYNMPMGVYVAQITDDGGAAASDLKVGDIITAINGSTITGMSDLQSQLSYYAAGTEVTLTVKRANGENGYDEAEVKITLGHRPTQESSAEQQPQQRQQQDGQSGSNPFGWFFGGGQ